MLYAILILMAQLAIQPLSFEDLYRQIQALPEGVTGEILEPGTLRAMSRPSRRHRRAAQRFFVDLQGINQDAGGQGWWVELEAEIRLPNGRLVVPDLSAWRVERVPELPQDNPLTIFPDWCCEVLSPTTARDDRRVKLPLYARSGIDWVWLIDPELRLLEVFETVAGRPTLVVSACEGVCSEVPPFGLSLDITPWWLP